MDLDIEMEVKKEAQIVSRDQYSINNMTMNIEPKLETGMGNLITDIICLKSGHVILVEHLTKVYLFTADGIFEKRLKIPGEALGVTQINENSIVISYPHEKVIKIFNMEKDAVTKVIQLDKTFYGLSFCNSSLAVGVGEYFGGSEINIIILEGNTKKSVQVQSKCAINHLVYHNDRIMYSDVFGRAITCIDGSGKHIWQYHLSIYRPMGLSIDVYGNAIVANNDYDTIIVISIDGLESKKLISEDDGVKYPQCICLKI